MASAVTKVSARSSLRTIVSAGLAFGIYAFYIFRITPAFYLCFYPCIAVRYPVLKESTFKFVIPASEPGALNFNYHTKR